MIYIAIDERRLQTAKTMISSGVRILKMLVKFMQPPPAPKEASFICETAIVTWKEKETLATRWENVTDKLNALLDEGKHLGDEELGAKYFIRPNLPHHEGSAVLYIQHGDSVHMCVEKLPRGPHDGTHLLDQEQAKTVKETFHPLFENENDSDTE